MEELKNRSGCLLKYLIALAGCVLLRLVPFRPANVEPLMASVMPISKRSNYLASFMFGFLGVLIYDLFTGFGVWTWVTGLTYGLLGIGSAFYFRNRESSAKNDFCYGVVATVIYDVITGLIMGPVIFHQSFMVALIGQIPFTGRHLLGNMVLSVTLSPVIYRWVVDNGKLEDRVLLKYLAS